MTEEQTNELNVLELAGELTIAWLSNPNTRATAEDVPAFLGSMHSAVAKLAAPQASEEQSPAPEEFTGAVSVRKSLASPEHIISMIDGKPYKTLKRHAAKHGLTPDEYRERYGLKADYPMVAANYAAHRRELAKQIGLGRKPGQKAGSAKPAAAKSPRVKAAPAPTITPVAQPAPASKAVSAAKAAPASKAAPAAKAAPTAKVAPRRKLGVQFDTGR